MFTFLDIIGHFFNILYVVGSSFKKILYLRATLVLAAILEIYYYWNITDTPLWTDIIWSIIFIAINAWWVSVLVYEKATLNLEPDEKKMLDITFKRMNPVHFKKLLKLGSKKVIKNEKNIIKESTHINELMLIMNGIVKVYREDKILAYLREGSFVGEMSFMSGDTTTANVDTLEDTEVIIWNKAELKQFLKKNENIRKELNDVFSEDLIRKLVTD